MAADRKSQSGFSMMEVIISLVILTVITRFAVLNINAIIPGMKTNEASAQVVDQFRKARQLAIAQRRAIAVAFVGTDHIDLVRQDVPAGTTVLRAIDLSNRVEFRRFEGVPDTPDGFGNASDVDFGNAISVMFLTDGTLVDSLGQSVSGTVFLGLPNHPETARAVTILGATGRVRAYRWTGTAWIQ